MAASLTCIMPSLYTIAVGLMTLGSMLAALNWLYLFLTWYTGRFHSAIPLIGGLFLGVGMLLLPTTRPYAWAGVLLDYGTMIAVFAVPYLINEWWSTSQFNLVEEYGGQLGNKTVNLRLFRRGIFTMEQQLHRLREERVLMATGTIGDWQREPSRLLLRRGEKMAILESSANAEPRLLRLTKDFPDFEGTWLSLMGIDLQRKDRVESA